MTNDKFTVLWNWLDGLYGQRIAGGKLTDLHHGGKINFARRIQDDLDEWCDIVVARAKAEFDSAKVNFEALQEAAGERFDTIEPDHIHGLNFYDKSPR